MSSVDGTISLQQAKAPLGSGEGRFSVEVSALDRGDIRRLAAQIGVDWFEQKNMLTSYFIFRGRAETMVLFHAKVKAAEEESNRD